jgi:predicted ATPase
MQAMDEANSLRYSTPLTFQKIFKVLLLFWRFSPRLVFGTLSLNIRLPGSLAYERMSSRRNRTIRMPAPYLRRVWLDPSRIADRAAYPFCLPFLQDDFELRFDRSITIIVGENGTGKSTFLEGIAALAGYDEAGGGKGYRPVDHSKALEKMGGQLSSALRAGWLPKITNGWFFRAESFFTVARYLDEAARDGGGAPPDFLSHSHGEGFLRFYEERCQRQGIFIFDEPESALSPARQIEFLKLMRRMEFPAIARSSWPRIRPC